MEVTVIFDSFRTVLGSFWDMFGIALGPFLAFLFMFLFWWGRGEGVPLYVDKLPINRPSGRSVFVLTGWGRVRAS